MRGVRGYPAGLDRVARRQAEAVTDAGRAANDRLTSILPGVDGATLQHEDLDHLATLAGALEEYLLMQREVELEDQGIDLDGLPEDEQRPFYREGKQLLATYRRLLGARGPHQATDPPAVSRLSTHTMNGSCAIGRPTGAIDERGISLRQAATGRPRT